MRQPVSTTGAHFSRRRTGDLEDELNEQLKELETFVSHTVKSRSVYAPRGGARLRGSISSIRPPRRMVTQRTVTDRASLGSTNDGNVGERCLQQDVSMPLSQQKVVDQRDETSPPSVSGTSWSPSRVVSPNRNCLPCLDDLIDGTVCLEHTSTLSGGINGMTSRVRCVNCQSSESNPVPLVRKQYRDSMHTVAESLADIMYTAFGCNVPESRLYVLPRSDASTGTTVRGMRSKPELEIFRLSRFVNHAMPLREVQQSQWATVVNILAEGYVADALICNRDLIDPRMANVLIQNSPTALFSHLCGK